MGVAGAARAVGVPVGVVPAHVQQVDGEQEVQKQCPDDQGPRSMDGISEVTPVNPRSTPTASDLVIRLKRVRVDLI